MLRHRNRRYRAGINDALHARALGRRNQPPGPLYITLVKLFWMLGPQPIIRGYVKHPAHAAHRAFDRPRIPQVPFHPFHPQIFQQLEITRGTHQYPNIFSGRDQLASDVTTDETGRAGNERGHITRIALFPGCGNFSPRASLRNPAPAKISGEFTF